MPRLSPTGMAACACRRGIPPARINITGLGESEPVATNDTDAGRQLNRRVEVAIYANDQYREEVRRRVGG